MSIQISTKLRMITNIPKLLYSLKTLGQRPCCESHNNFKFDPARVFVPIFRQKGQRSRSHGPTEFSKLRRLITDKIFAAEMFAIF